MREDQPDFQRQIAISQALLKFGLVLATGWVAIGLLLQAPRLTEAALIAGVGFALGLFLHHRNWHTFARCTWLIGAGASILYGSLFIHPDGQTVLMLVPFSGVPLIVFSWRNERFLMVLFGLLPIVLWLITWSFDRSVLGPYEIGAEIAGQYVAIATALTTFSLVAFELGYFAILTERYEQHLEESRLSAEKAYAAKSIFLANMSHELRTPLNAIMGFTESLQSETFGPVGNEQNKEYLGHVHDSAGHLLTFIDDILDISSIESGELELQKDEILVSDVVESARNIVRPVLDEKNINLNVDTDSEDLCVRADGKRLMQVIIKLLSNAAKFSEAGCDVSIRFGRTGDDVWISVADAGIGMSESDISVAERSFEQVSSGFSRDYAGSGLGLPLSKGLMELHGGNLSIQSEKGKGTTVVVSLPDGKKA